MKKFFRLMLVSALLFLLASSMAPTAPAQAAAAPAFSTKRSSLYENGSNEGSYAYTIKNLKKGDKVTWSLSGSGAAYLTLEKTTTLVNGAKAVNHVQVNTQGSQAAKNKKATLTARIYNSQGELSHKLSDSFAIKINSSYLQITSNKITDSLESLSVGQAYDFDCSISPANATSRLYWRVTTQSGTDCSSQITADGIWRPVAEGSYFIQAYTKNSASGRIISSARIQATVGSTLSEIHQTAADAVTAIFTGSMKNKVALSDFSIRFLSSGTPASGSSSSGSPIALKEISLSEDEKSVIVKTQSPFANQAVYEVSYKGAVISTFNASVGKPVSGVILTSEAPINTSYDIAYVLYDSNGIDVTSVYKQLVYFSAAMPSGNISSSGRLYMDQLGEYASVTMKYNGGDTDFTVSANILCTAAGSSGIHVAITDSTNTPAFESSSTDASFYLGDTAYFHFQALDENGYSAAYAYPSYASLDTSIFTVASDGKLTGKKAGTAILSIYCTVNSKQMHYQVSITVLPRPALSQLLLSESNITMSNVQEEGYETVLTLSAYDQYFAPIDQTKATATIREENNKAVLAHYDNSTGKITISAKGAKPGIYNYSISLRLSGSQASASFQLTVQAVPESGLDTYAPEPNTAVIDTGTLSSASAPLCFELRLAHYINGIFAGYATIRTATVQSEQGWHGNDLTAPASSEAQKIYPWNNQITLTAAYWPNIEAASAAKKAASGSYTVTLEYGMGGKAQSVQLVLVVN